MTDCDHKIAACAACTIYKLTKIYGISSEKLFSPFQRIKIVLHQIIESGYQLPCVGIIPWSIITVLLIEIFFYSMEQMEAEKEKAGYQYEALKSQVNPHFLFNCLNVLSSLVWTDAEKANLFAKKLSGVYRYILSTREKDTVTLDEEMEFVRSYIYLEKIRFDGRLDMDIVEVPGFGHRAVVPASIQALVENALKHNVNSKEHPLRITLTVGKRGISVSNSIRLRDNVPGYGIGLGNIRQQYALHGRDIEVVRDQDTFTVRLPYIR